MRPFTPRGAVAVLLSAALIVATPAVTATAASARPAQVGLISFVGASLESSGATLTIDWSDVEGAKKYEVFTSTSYDALPKKTTPKMTVTSSKAKITRLAKGRDYFVQVRAVGDAGVGPRSWRVGHRTITAEASVKSTSPRFSAMTWNICSNMCSGFSTRKKVINNRIAELTPSVVAFQEASKYVTAPSGYTFAYNGQNDLLVRKGEFSTIKKNSKGATSGYAKFGKKYSSPGKGIAWAALKHRSGSYVVVVNVHMIVGTSGKPVAQREYEASRVQPYITKRLKMLKASHGSLTDWSKVPVVVLGDFNTQKSRTGDDTMKVLMKSGWHDGFDQARSLKRQHHNTANPDMLSKPIVGITWGAHIDKVLVKPTRAVVYRWENAGKMSGSRYVTPLGSDHHPLLVDLAVR